MQCGTTSLIQPPAATWPVPAPPPLIQLHRLIPHGTRDPTLGHGSRQPIPPAPCQSREVAHGGFILQSVASETAGSSGRVQLLCRQAHGDDSVSFTHVLLSCGTFALNSPSICSLARHEIASCEEKAYDSLPLSDAATLLFFDNLQDVLSFAQEVSRIIHSFPLSMLYPVLTVHMSRSPIAIFNAARMASQPLDTGSAILIGKCGRQRQLDPQEGNNLVQPPVCQGAREHCVTDAESPSPICTIMVLVSCN